LEAHHRNNQICKPLKIWIATYGRSTGPQMRVTLSERTFLERIRQLEGLGSEVTADEINHRLTHFAGKLFEHLRGFGINQVGYINSTGTLGTFYVGLDSCFDDESRNKRIEGLAMLDPLSVTLEERDLPAFFRDIVLTMMVDAFDSYSAQFQRLTVGELNSKLVDTANKVFAAPSGTHFIVETEEDATALNEIREQEYQLFLLRSGKKDPMAKHNAIEEHRRAEEAAEHARREAAYEQFRRGSED
jgi:hypothetical protein